MRVVMVVIVMHPAPTPTASPPTAAPGHGHAALFADLRVLGLHAGGDFLPIRDEVGTQPHRIGRANLLDVDGRLAGGGALGAGLLKATKQPRADRQCQPANEKRRPHLSFPALGKSSHCGAKVSYPPSTVQAKNFG